MPVLYQGCDCGTDVFQSLDCEVLVLDNSYTAPMIDNDSVINPKALGFRFITIDTFIGHLAYIDLGTTCDATSCDPRREYKNHITKLRVTTLHKYSYQYDVNSVVTSLFAKDHNTADASGYLDFMLLSKTEDILLLDTTALHSKQKFRFDILFSDGLHIIRESPTLTVF
ncbi:MAG: hypothetical protein ABIV51_05630 [Saprospiraceae bacterium]